MRTIKQATLLLALTFGVAGAQTAPSTEPATAPAARVIDGRAMFDLALKFDRRTMGEAFDKIGVKNPKADVLAKAFLDRLSISFAAGVTSNVYAPAGDYSPAALLAMADLAVDAGSKDPLVLYGRLAMLKDTGRHTDYNAILDQTAAGLMTSHYSDFRKLAVLNRFMVSGIVRQNRATTARRTKQSHDEWLKCMQEPLADPLERRLKIEILCETLEYLPSADRADFLAALDATAGIDPWYAAMVHGSAETTNAWALRGGGYADTVTAEGANGFENHLRLAEAAYEKANALEPTYPEAATRLIYVAQGLGNGHDSPRGWFERAIAIQPDFMPAWHAYLFALTPKWGGSNDEMFDLGHTALMTGHFDGPLPFFQLEALREIAKQGGAKFDYDVNPKVWPNVKAVFEGYLATPFPTLNVTAWQTQELGYAYRCRQYAEAAKLLETLKGKPSAATLAEFGTNVEDVTSETNAMNSDQASAIVSAIAAERSGNYADAADRLATIQKAINPDHPAAAYVDLHAALCQRAADIAAGKKVEFTFKDPSDLALWRGDKGLWKMVDNTLVTSGDHEIDPSLQYAGPMPPNARIHIEWSYTLLPPRNEEPAFSLSFMDIGTDKPDTLRITGFPLTDFIHAMGDGFRINSSIAKQVPMPPNAWHSWTLEHQGKTIKLIGDGQTLINHATDDWFGYGRPMLGFIALTGGNGATMKVRHITVESMPPLP